MERERLEELLAGRALDSLDAEEQAELETELAQQPELAEELDELREAAALVGMGVTPSSPSEETCRKVMAMAASTRTGESRRRWPTLFGRIQAPALAIMAAAIAVLLFFVIGTGTKVDSLQEQVADLNGLSKRQGESLQALANWGDRGIRLIGTEKAPDAYGYLLVTAADDMGVLVITDLPPLAPGQVFQLWLSKAEGRVNGGVLEPTGGNYEILVVRSAEPLSGFRGFGMTIEPAGGSDGPTGSRVLSSIY